MEANDTKSSIKKTFPIIFFAEELGEKVRIPPKMRKIEYQRYVGSGFLSHLMK